MNQTRVHHAVTVPVPLERAFAVFTGEMADWWPAQNTFGKDAYEKVLVEPWEGGRWFERDTEGHETSWGIVRVWDPPRHLGLTWQITAQGTPEPDPEKASIIDVRFVPETPLSTRVEVEHRGFERHGDEQGALWQQAMDSADGGWPHFLHLFGKAV